MGYLRLSEVKKGVWKCKLDKHSDVVCLKDTKPSEKSSQRPKLDWIVQQNSVELNYNTKYPWVHTDIHKLLNE